jgi:hypothetical protein
MPVDPSVVGTELPAVTMTVEAGRLRFFAKAIGETSEIYAGPGDVLPVPPTFLKGGALEFIVKHTEVTRADGSAVAELTSTVVVRPPEVVR